MSNKIILNLAMSLDGFIADSKGGYDWIVPSGDHTINTNGTWNHKDFLQHVGAVVMGMKSYEQNLHAEYSDKPVYVITSQKQEGYENIHFIGGDVLHEIMELKKEVAGDIYLFGGGVSIDPLLKAGIIEEFIIGIIPIILGAGIPLFLHSSPAIPLYLTHYYVENGIVILRYIPRDAHENS